jgi:hypothetical protein
MFAYVEAVHERIQMALIDLLSSEDVKLRLLMCDASSLNFSSSTALKTVFLSGNRLHLYM